MRPDTPRTTSCQLPRERVQGQPSAASRLRSESQRSVSSHWSEVMRNELARRLATSTPDQVLGSLGLLVAEGKITMEEANDVYTEARRLQIIMEARQSVMKAAEDVVVHNLRSVGCARSEMSEIQFSEVRVKFQQAVDDLIVQTQRANTMTWKLHVLPKL